MPYTLLPILYPERLARIREWLSAARILMPAHLMPAPMRREGHGRDN